MKKRILVYGDSNSWGVLDDGLNQRFDDRWPVVMSRQLGTEWELTEACLPGRTVDKDDAVMSSQQPDIFNGRTHLPAVLLSCQPIDTVIVMLGTNDLKARFSASARDIAASLIALGGLIQQVPCGVGPWRSDIGPQNVGDSPRILFICPPALGKLADNPGWERYPEWLGGRAKSLALPDILQTACENAGFGFVDANPGVASSDIDPIHWDQDNQRSLGALMARELQH